MLSLPDVQEFGLNNHYYFNKNMETCQISGYESRPNKGKFTIEDKTVNLYLYDNPWASYYSNYWQKSVINSVFQYCIICGAKNFQNYEFENLEDVDHNKKSPINCSQTICQDKISELFDYKYVKLIYAIHNKSADEIKKHTNL